MFILNKQAIFEKMLRDKKKINAILGRDLSWAQHLRLILCAESKFLAMKESKEAFKNYGITREKIMYER